MYNSIIVCCLMMFTAVLSEYFKPTEYLADAHPVLLEEFIPKQFGDWKVQPESYQGVVNPQALTLSDKLYSQMLTRVYINEKKGHRIGLLIAYGKDQRDGLALHYPEVCYPSQGYQISSNQKSLLQFENQTLPVRKLVANYNDQMIEPITYWTTIGFESVLGGIDKKMAEMKYGFSGYIPDGMLIRVSSLDRDVNQAFVNQEAFIQDLNASLAIKTSNRIFGGNKKAFMKKMGDLKKTMLMTLSTGIRLLFSMVSFILIARYLGPSSFGQFVFLLTIATLLSFIANFGLSPYLLKEIGSDLDSFQSKINLVISARFYISSIILCFIVLLAFFQAIMDYWILVLLLIAMTIDNFIETLNTGFRCISDFDTETKIVTIVSIVQFFIFLIVLNYYPSVFAVVLAFLLGKIIHLFHTIYEYLKLKFIFKIEKISLTFNNLKKLYHYAQDFLLQSLFGQIDNLIIGHYFGNTLLGIYQAGFRLFNGGAQAASIFSNVFLPQLAAASQNKQDFVKILNKTGVVFISFGFIFGFVLAAGSKFWVDILFGNAYLELVSVLKILGLLFIVRFIASFFGVVLTSLGLQKFRSLRNAEQWFLILILFVALFSDYGLNGWIYSVIFGNIYLMFRYFLRLKVLGYVTYIHISLPLLFLMFFVILFISFG